MKATRKYKHCNHHHELTADYTIVDYGNGKFVANNKAIPLLKALNELGLKTRTHHITDEEDEPYDRYISILLDNVEVVVRNVFERDATRTKYNGRTELLIIWKRKKEKKDDTRTNKES